MENPPEKKPVLPAIELPEGALDDPEKVYEALIKAEAERSLKDL